MSRSTDAEINTFESAITPMPPTMQAPKKMRSLDPRVMDSIRSSFHTMDFVNCRYCRMSIVNFRLANCRRGRRRSQTKSRSLSGTAFSYNLAATYSHMAFRHTTIGATMFHFRVRDGTGWFHCAVTTRAGGSLRLRRRASCSGGRQ